MARWPLSCHIALWHVSNIWWADNDSLLSRIPGSRLNRFGRLGSEKRWLQCTFRRAGCSPAKRLGDTPQRRSCVSTRSAQVIHIRQERHDGDGTDVREHTFLHPLRIWFHSMEDPLPIATRTGTSRKAARHVLPGIEICCLSRAIPPRIICIRSSHTVERAIIFL